MSKKKQLRRLQRRIEALEAQVGELQRRVKWLEQVRPQPDFRFPVYPVHRWHYTGPPYRVTCDMPDGIVAARGVNGDIVTASFDAEGASSASTTERWGA